MPSHITGRLVTETLDYDRGRQVTVYVPPVPPEAVVFAGDGQLIGQWGGVLEAADVPSTMIVGTHRLADEMPRLQEYSPDFDANGSRHTRSPSSKTFADGRAHVLGSRCPRSERRCLASPRVESSRSQWGFAIRTSTVPSSARRRAGVTDAVMPKSLPRAYFVAGTLEPFFLENATRWAVALHEAGADIVISERVGSHGDAFWREFPLMVAWAFGR